MGKKTPKLEHRATPGDHSTQLVFLFAVGNEVFLDSFLISIAALPGNIWTMVHMDKLGKSNC